MDGADDCEVELFGDLLGEGVLTGEFQAQQTNTQALLLCFLHLPFFPFPPFLQLLPLLLHFLPALIKLHKQPPQNIPQIIIIHRLTRHRILFLRLLRLPLLAYHLKVPIIPPLKIILHLLLRRLPLRFSLIHKLLYKLVEKLAMDILIICVLLVLVAVLGDL